MTIVRDVDHEMADIKGAVIALGNFDGVHLGHRAILSECIALAQAHGVPSAAMTFEPHPREFFSPDHTPLRLYSFRQKIEAIHTCGIEHIIVMRFNRKLASTSADEFVERILHRTLEVKHVVTGYNFAFGKGRGGDSLFLTEKARALNFGFTAHPQVMSPTGDTISSSAIRTLLSDGHVHQATSMLGRPYEICGHVIRGAQRGRTLGFPTLNLSLKKLFKPRFGVYACRVHLSGGHNAYDAVANIGIKPTFSADTPLLEVHAFGMTGDAYGRLARVELIEFLREEKKFDGPDALKKQIANDCVRAQNILQDG